tara:strand:- start:7705 stop:8007 length:303 start_codon:yes stop_codon:yes gene_type:complete
MPEDIFLHLFVDFAGIPTVTTVMCVYRKGQTMTNSTIESATSREKARLAAQIAKATKQIDWINIELASDRIGAFDRSDLQWERRQLRSLRRTARRLIANL